MTALILPHHGKDPQIHSSVYLAPNATIIGEVSIAQDSSIWFGAVVRGDVNNITIGERSNVQDLSMLHVSYKKSSLTIGNDVTIGHSCVLHACTLKNRILIGMGSIVMDNAVIEDDVIIGAGSLVTEGTHIPPQSLVIGRPAKIVRTLSAKELEFLKWSAAHYIKVVASYRGGPMPY